MNNTILQDMIVKAASRNTVHFDHFAPSGNITSRLLDLVAKDMYGGLGGIVVSDTAHVENEVLLKYRHLAIYRVKSAEFARCVSYYLNTYEGGMASGDKQLLVAISNNFDFFLCSY